MASRRPLYVTAATAALAGAALVPVVPLALRDRLPDPLATHWNAAGAADGHASFTAWTLMCLGVWLVFCASAVAAGFSGRRRRRVRGVTGATLGFGAGLTAGMILMTVRANLDRDSYREAADLGWGPVALVLLGSVAVALVGWLLGNTGPEGPPSGGPDGAEPRLRTPLPEGERPVWVGYARSRPVFLLGGALAAVGLLAALSAALLPEPLTPGAPLAWPLLLLACAGLVCLALSSARVTADEAGLAVGFGPLGRPVRRIPLESISAAWTEDRSPAEVGGWGYRISGKGTTVMLRGGECLVVGHGRDSRFAVSVDDAERAAALLNSLRDRAGSP